MNRKPAVLFINGPNLNLLGRREPDIYGHRDYSDLCNFIRGCCEQSGVEYDIFQSNYEGSIVDAIQNAYGRFDGIVINAAAYTHTSIAILDALLAVGLPAAEVHLSDISAREPFRRISMIRQACLAAFSGAGFESYRAGLTAVLDAITTKDGGKNQ